MIDVSTIIKTLAGVLLIPVATGAWYIMDQSGVRPATKNELNQQGRYLTRQRLLDRLEDGNITEFQRGVLHGLCFSMNIKQQDCEKRDE